MRVLLTLYNRVLQRHPILTPAIQTSILMSAGDAIAQTLVERKRLKDYNCLRTAQFATIGFCMAGPTLTMWYRLLAKLVGEKGSIVTLKKVALDQVIFAPSFIVVFLATLGTLQGQKADKVVENIRRDYKDIMITNYKIWPCVQLVNFYVVPLQYQVLLVQCVALIWNTYLSWKTQSSELY